MASEETIGSNGQTIDEINFKEESDYDDSVELEDAPLMMKTQKRKAKQRKTSVAWAFFEMLPTKGDEKPKYRCKKCGVVYVASGTHGTRNLKCHLKTCPISDTKDVGQILLG